MIGSSFAEVKQAFYAFLAEKEYPHFDPITDQKIHRYSRGKGSKNNAWYSAMEFTTPSGRPFLIVNFGDWRANETWLFKSGGHYSSVDTEYIHKRHAEFEKLRSQEKEAARDYAKSTASDMLGRGSDSVAVYLKNKGITKPYGSRLLDGECLIPVMKDDAVVGLQRIFENGDKKFLRGSDMRGGYFIVGNGKPAYLCEGFATACSIHEATGKAVVLAFSVGNLQEVAKKFYSKKLVICADDDRFTDGNPGVTTALGVAQTLGCMFVKPIFNSDHGTDFNDLMMQEGLDAVKKQLSDKDNVVSITKNKPKEFNEIVRELAAQIETGIGPLSIRFPYEYRAVEYEEGKRLLVKCIDSDNAIYKYVSEKAMYADLVRWTRPLSFSMKSVRELFDIWFYSNVPIPEPRSFKWPGESGQAFHLLPWNCEPGETPLFDEMMGRISNSEALQIFIGSLFIPESNLQQYVWLYGTGNDGKGTLTRFLQKVFNGSFCSRQTPAPDSRFWTYGLMGKRLCVFPDCNNTTFVTSGMFKSLTGGDPLEVEIKHGESFTVKFSCKFMVFSNSRPSISSEDADKRRIILCEAKTFGTVADGTYEDRLWQEGGAFIARCIEKYKAACPTHGPQMVIDDGSLEDWLSTVEERFEVFFERNFELNKNAHVLPKDFDALLLDEFKSRHEQKEFREWLERRHGIRKKTQRNADRYPKVYPGISRRVDGKVTKHDFRYKES